MSFELIKSELDKGGRIYLDRLRDEWISKDLKQTSQEDRVPRHESTFIDFDGCLIAW